MLNTLWQRAFWIRFDQSLYRLREVRDVAEDDPHAETNVREAVAAPSDLTGMAAFRRQVEAIADDRGLAAQQVAGTRQLENMPDVTPTAFGAITGIVDCLLDADLRMTDGAGTTERNDADDG